MSPRVSGKATSVRSGLLRAMLVFALALRLAVPAGWMPSFDDGGVRLTLCSGEQPMMHAGHDADHSKSDHDEQSPHAHPCSYAVAGAPMLRAPQPALQTPILPASTVLVGEARAPPGSEHPAALPPPATGPPSIA